MSNVQNLIDLALLKHGSNSWKPTDAHRKAKAAFWSHYFQSGETAPEQTNAALAARISGFPEVLEWWQLSGFPEWFRNGEEFRQRVEYVSSLALDLLQETLLDVTGRPVDRLNAAKMALEIAAKFPKSTPKEQFADEKIGEMDKKQLEEFIASKLKTLRPDTPTE